jgi:hypothetical protein
MDTSDERLAFAVGFAQMDLSRLRPGDWLNLREDVTAFLGLTPESMTPLASLGGISVGVYPPYPQELTEEQFEFLRIRTYDLLVSKMENIAMAQVGEPPTENDSVPFPGGNIMFMVRPYAPEWRAVPEFRGLTSDMFLLILTLLLGQQPPDRIRRCPECQKLFLRIRKQGYCGRTCVNRVNKRTWREAQEMKAQQRPARKRTTKKA